MKRSSSDGNIKRLSFFQVNPNFCVKFSFQIINFLINFSHILYHKYYWNISIPIRHIKVLCKSYHWCRCWHSFIVSTHYQYPGNSSSRRSGKLLQRVTHYCVVDLKTWHLSAWSTNEIMIEKTFFAISLYMNWSWTNQDMASIQKNILKNKSCIL